jgi:mannosyltransferase
VYALQVNALQVNALQVNAPQMPVPPPRKGPDGETTGLPRHRQVRPHEDGSRRWALALRRPAPELAVLVAGLLVFAWQLGVPSPSRDEGATMAVCRRSLAEMVRTAQHVDLVHLSFYLVAHVVLTVHDSVTAVRLISVVAMASAAAALVSLGRRLGDPAVGALAGTLLVISPLASRYAQEARPFALVTLLAVLATNSLTAVLATSSPTGARRPQVAWRWARHAGWIIALGVVNVLGLLLLTTHACYLLITQPLRTTRRWLVTSAAALAISSPYLLLAFGQRGQVSWLSRPRLYDLTAAFILPFATKAMTALFALTVAIALGVAVGVHRGLPQGAQGRILALGLAWAILPPVSLWTASQVHPYWDQHYVLFALPGLMLLVAGAVRTLASDGVRLLTTRIAAIRRYVSSRESPTRMLVAGTAVVAALSLATLPTQAAYRDPATGHDDDLLGVADYLAAHARVGDAVLYAPYKLRIIGTVYPARTHTASRTSRSLPPR